MQQHIDAAVRQAVEIARGRGGGLAAISLQVSNLSTELRSIVEQTLERFKLSHVQVHFELGGDASVRLLAIETVPHVGR